MEEDNSLYKVLGEMLDDFEAAVRSDPLLYPAELRTVFKGIPYWTEKILEVVKSG